MKSLKEFISSESSLNEEIESLEEKQNHEQPHDPPAILILKRKYIRQFPGGQNVALYYSDKLNKFVTIPYADMQWSAVKEETEELQEDIIKHLNSVRDRQGKKSYKFQDGSSMSIDPQTANAVLKVHSALNDENKKKVSDMAQKSKQHFAKVVDFAWKHVK